jgi:prepilin-type N-terminal cleavage/methylation domain-containing protein
MLGEAFMNGLEVVETTTSGGRKMRTRRGFTLVELLVSMALVIFIMVIVSETFVSALDSVRLLKAQGEMQANLRAASSRLRSDLTSPHFIGNGPNVSDQNLALGSVPSWGYFRVMHGSPPMTGNPYINEAPADPHPSYAATDHVLSFTRFDPGTQQWYETVYYLLPNGESAGGTSLNALYRSQNGPVLPYQVPPGGAPDNGSQPTQTQVVDLSMPYWRYGMSYADWQNGPASNFAPGVAPNGTPLPPPINPIAGAPIAQIFSGTRVRWGMPSWFQSWQQQINGPNAPYTFAMDPYWMTNTQGWPPAQGYFSAPQYNQRYMAPFGGFTPPNPAGDDILLTNVITFEVRLSVRTASPQQQPTPSAFLNLFDMWPSANKQFSQSGNNLFIPGGPYTWDNQAAVFDTWFQSGPPTSVASKLSAAQLNMAQNIDPQGTILKPPLPIQVVAVQITLRVWDDRTQQARQVTIVQNV